MGTGVAAAGAAARGRILALFPGPGRDAALPAPEHPRPFPGCGSSQAGGDRRRAKDPRRRPGKGGGRCPAQV